MIGRKNRFHGRGAIQRLQRGGKSVRFGALALRYAPNAGRKTYRLAVVVSRKVSKSAVVRNRIRRRIYERVRILSSNFTTPYDLIIMSYDESLADMPAEKLEADIVKLLKKAKLTSDNPGRHAIVEPKE
jgi:ribonuclease P protein component